MRKSSPARQGCAQLTFDSKESERDRSKRRISVRMEWFIFWSRKLPNYSVSRQGGDKCRLAYLRRWLRQLNPNRLQYPPAYPNLSTFRFPTKAASGGGLSP